MTDATDINPAPWPPDGRETYWAEDSIQHVKLPATATKEFENSRATISNPVGPAIPDAPMPRTLSQNVVVPEPDLDFDIAPADMDETRVWVRHIFSRDAIIPKPDPVLDLVHGSMASFPELLQNLNKHSNVSKFPRTSGLYFLARSALQKVLGEPASMLNVMPSGCAKIFAILTLMNKIPSVSSFEDSSLTDECLPLRIVAESRSQYYRAESKFRPERPIRMVLDGWDAADIDRFMDLQWRFLSPFFSRPDPREKKPRFYQFDKSCILPFTEVDHIQSGGFSDVYRVKIHPDHHDFPASYQRPDVSTSYNSLPKIPTFSLTRLRPGDTLL